MNYKERDHGYGDSPEVDGSPRVINQIEEECPNCGCPRLYVIEVTLVDDDKNKNIALLAGDGNPTGTYIGCPACPFASPMMTTRKQ